MHALTGSDIERIVADLHHRYSDITDRDEVMRAVDAARADLEPTSRHPEFLAVLVERRAREAVLEAARARGEQVHPVPEILFVCVHNEGRSPMAAALAEHYGGEHVHVRSAGTEPSGGLNPVVADVMRERGVALHHFPAAIVDDPRRVADVVVHVGEHIPDLPGRRQVTWPVPDPKDQPVEVVREIADDVDARVRELLLELGVDRAV
jgi:arsenate reductase (thioredoxin)